jgi:hypothetical protein
MSNTAVFDAPNNTGSNVTQDIGQINNHTNPERPDYQVKKCLDALFVADPKVDRSALTRTKGDVVFGTCDWIEEHPLYREWVQSITK